MYLNSEGKLNKIEVKSENLFSTITSLFITAFAKSQLDHNAVFALKSLPSWHNM